MKRLILATILCLIPVMASASTVNLGINNTDPKATVTNIYQAKAPQTSWAKIVTIPKATAEYAIKDLTPGTYSWYVTGSKDNLVNESVSSAVVTNTLQTPPPVPVVDPNEIKPPTITVTIPITITLP